jgi:hypothetical protein
MQHSAQSRVDFYPRSRRSDPFLSRQHGAIRSTARAIVSSSGVYGLWRGTSATLIR